MNARGASGRAVRAQRCLHSSSECSAVLLPRTSSGRALLCPPCRRAIFDGRASAPATAAARTPHPDSKFALGCPTRGPIRRASVRLCTRAVGSRCKLLAHAIYFIRSALASAYRPPQTHVHAADSALTTVLEYCTQASDGRSHPTQCTICGTSAAATPSPNAYITTLFHLFLNQVSFQAQAHTPRVRTRRPHRSPSREQPTGRVHADKGHGVPTRPDTRGGDDWTCHVRTRSGE